MKLRRLKILRNYRRLSVIDVAEKVGISPSYYCQLENGKRNLYYKMAVRIANVFNVKPDDIFYKDFVVK